MFHIAIHLTPFGLYGSNDGSIFIMRNEFIMMKERIKKMKYGPLLINYKRIIMQRVNSRLYDDETAVKRMYKKRLGRELNLENPERFTEKLQWEKLYYRNPVMTTRVDKIAVRDYLTKKGYREYLMPVVGIFRSPDKINVKELPEKCILKTSQAAACILSNRVMMWIGSLGKELYTIG